MVNTDVDTWSGREFFTIGREDVTDCHSRHGLFCDKIICSFLKPIHIIFYSRRKR